MPFAIPVPQIPHGTGSTPASLLPKADETRNFYQSRFRCFVQKKRKLLLGSKNTTATSCVPQTNVFRKLHCPVLLYKRIFFGFSATQNHAHSSVRAGAGFIKQPQFCVFFF